MSASIERRRTLATAAGVQAVRRPTDYLPTVALAVEASVVAATQIRITPEAVKAVKDAWPGAWDNEAENLIRAMSAHYGFEVLG